MVRDSTSATQKLANEKSALSNRHFNESDRDHESQRSTLISEMIVDKSIQTRCNDSDNMSGVEEFRQSDVAGSIMTCDTKSNADSSRKYSKRKTRLPSGYSDFELGRQNQKRLRTDQTVTNKLLNKTDESHRTIFSSMASTSLR